MSKHPIPGWLRSQFSRIEDEVQKLGPYGVFTQMRTVTQTYFEQQAEAAQPPACCTPTAEENALLAAGDYRPEELWGVGGKPSCPKCYTAPQPPALSGVPAGLDLQRIVTEALMGMIAAVTSTSPPANEPPPPFIQAGIDRAVSRISAHIAPLQAEIERRDSKPETMRRNNNELNEDVAKLNARCDELLDLLLTLVTQHELPIAARDLCNGALSKPAGSEQV
ncbi:hypothetical protein [Pseudomonas syringae]|uniref:hypothetical protein n=1 Tax=Pseudomonas syringae TaxID=317 RepID=UPI0013C2D33C|nr:hypothetical protein [Pseudomonas syringae]